MRSVVALFDNFDDAQQAVRALRDANFARDDINMISRDSDGEYARYFKDHSNPAVDHQDVGDGAAAGAGIGAILGGLGGVLVGLGALAIPGIGPVLAAGPIVAALAGAGLGAVAGGLVGALVDLGIPEEHANRYAEGVRGGGTLVTVRAQDEMAEQARELLNRYHPVDMDKDAREAHQTLPLHHEAATPLDDMAATMGASAQMRSSYGMPAVIGPVDQSAEDVYNHERFRDQADDIPVTGEIYDGKDVDILDVNPVSSADWSVYDNDFRRDFGERYRGSTNLYENYQPAYHYGYDLAIDQRYHGYAWQDLEPTARAEWDHRGLSSAWDDVKDAVRHAWDMVSNQTH